MDKLKKQRGAERGAVTRLVTVLDGDLAKDPLPVPEIQASLQLLAARIVKLADLDDKVKDLMLDDDTVTNDVIEAEAVTAEDYMRKATLVRVKAEAVITVHPPHSHYQSADESSSNSPSRRRNFKLPKVELRKFGGELTEWLGWWAQFSKIDEDEELHDSDKFSYLVQSMVDGSRAYDVVKRFPQSTENYPKAISALKERFGKKKLLRQVYVRELIGMILNSKVEKKASLTNLFDRLESSLRSLESLGVNKEQMVEFLFPMVESCLPEDCLLAWQRSPHYGEDGSTSDPPMSELDFLMAFLKTEIDNEETRKLARAGFGLTSRDRKKGHHHSVQQDEDEPTAAGLFNGSSGGHPKSNCIFCDRNHESKDCFKAQVMTMEEKRRIIQQKKACFNCLKLGHMAKGRNGQKCKVNNKCHVCSKPHLVLMCPSLQEQKSMKEDIETTRNNLNCTSEVILMTLMVQVQNPKTEKIRTVRALLDSGSQRSYILRKTALELGLNVRKKVKVNHHLFGGAEVIGLSHCIYDITLSGKSGEFSSFTNFMDQPKICGSVPRMNEGQWMQELKEKGIIINDLNQNSSKDIELLIGADYMGSILTGKMEKLANGLIAMETTLGWTLMGRPKKMDDNFAMTILTMTITSSTVNELLDLETIGIQDPIEVKSRQEQEREAHQHFLETVTRDDDGRYSVDLPWRNGVESLPSNLDVAKQRLSSTTRKLNSMKKFDAYNKIFKDWEAEGIITSVEAGDEDLRCHYLPHRAVIKESRTTPVRPVFDASCRVGRNPALNDCLEKGPNLIELIPSILLRFRMGKIGFLADIRKAFLMISINEEHRQFLRFLWWEDSSQKKMKIYQHNRVVFGMNCSPFLLGAVIQHHLQSQSLHTTLMKKLSDSLYVDNLVMAVDNRSEYEQIKATATDVMSQAKMELRDWECSGQVGDREVTSVLGLKWDKMKDVLFCESISSEIPEKITKRVILSQIQRVFDPLGFLAPTVIVPKILLQSAWKVKQKWDDPVSEEMKLQFFSWWKDCSGVLEKIELPRNCGSNLENGRSQLHVFCDASQKAYAAVIFLRQETKEGVNVHFLQAKARVAPVKKATIPRLELLSCTIAARLADSTRRALSMEDLPIHFWSDSTTALSWIKRGDEWGIFVANRVKEILGLTKADQWRHVPGLINPADLPSRGISPSKLFESRWWEGPDWLKTDADQWPSAEKAVDEAEVNRERKISTLTVQMTEMPWYIRFNSYEKNLRMMSYVLRFIGATQKKVRSDDEIRTTELRLFKLVQCEAFKSNQSYIDGLKVERDRDGLIRVKTKLLHRKDSEFFIRPILLPHKHPLVDMVLQDVHQSNSHGGAQFLMAKLREKVWILQGRQAIKKVIRSCVKCRRFDSRKSDVPESALPENRVKDATTFQITGIDLTGALTLKNGGKVYIVLYTCAVYRCVHLELVESLSTEDFLMSLIRFVKRKTRPNVIYTDNGTNFRGADNLMQKIDWKEVEKRTRQQRIKWEFNPPSAPWWGGWWERLIRSVKDLLRKMLGFGKLTYVELETCLTEVEFTINHRPLTFVTEDGDDLIPLTPMMFIYNLPSSDEIPEAKLLKLPDLKGKKKSVDKLLEELRDRFRLEYLGQLVQRGKEKSRSFQVGEVVLVEKDKQKRIFWPMARILELIPGKDGVIRVARLKTKEGTLLRPIQRLFPLEVDTGELSDPNEDKKSMEKDVQVENTVMKTRSGRVVRKPIKYCDY